MTGISHAITGATIAVVIREPLLALPLAYLSHFVCDMIPHIGVSDLVDENQRKRRGDIIHLIDLVLILGFFGLLFTLGSPWVVIAGAMLAGLPDIVWFYRYIVKERWQHRTPGPMNKINRLHANIQWSESLKYGIPVESIYSIALLVFLVRNV